MRSSPGLQIVQPHVLLATSREVVRSGPDVYRGLMAAAVVEAPLPTQLPSSVADRSTRPGDEQLPLLMTRRATLGWVLCRAVAAEPGRASGTAFRSRGCRLVEDRRLMPDHRHPTR